MLWVRISIRARCTCTTLCDKVCQWLATGQWFSQGPPVSSTNKTDRHHITEILLREALNTIKQTNLHNFSMVQHYMYAAFTIEVFKCLVTKCPIWETITISHLIFFLFCQNCQELYQSIFGTLKYAIHYICFMVISDP